MIELSRAQEQRADVLANVHQSVCVEQIQPGVVRLTGGFWRDEDTFVREALFDVDVTGRELCASYFAESAR